jgi:hypothetical protein
VFSIAGRINKGNTNWTNHANLTNRSVRARMSHGNEPIFFGTTAQKAVACGPSGCAKKEDEEAAPASSSQVRRVSSTERFVKFVSFGAPG